MKFSHLHLHGTRKLDCREFCREQVGWVTCASLPTGGGNLTYIRKKSGILSIPSHSPIWQQNTKPTLPPPLCKQVCLCTSHRKFGLRAEDLHIENIFHFKSSEELLGTSLIPAAPCALAGIVNQSQQQDRRTYKGSRL